MNKPIQSVLFFLLVLSSHECIQLPEIYSYYHINAIESNITICKEALENFAQSSSNYILCTLSNARPIHMCQNCIQPYVSLLDDYDKILTLEDNGTKCREKLLNLDRLEIVQSMFTDMKNLWERGFCDKCFDWDLDKPTLSQQTLTFIKYFNATKECITSDNNNDTEVICENCMTDYLTLNSYYESLKGSSETVGLCMDIVDSMNATRSVWSGVLNCCKLRKTPEIMFLSATAIIACLPALFYFSAKIFSSSRPGIQVIGQQYFSESINENPGPSTSIQHG